MNQYELTIKRITAEETYPIRQQILRHGRPIETCYFSGDEAEDTYHFGAFINNQLVSICSIYHHQPEQAPTGDYWQVRGMATLAEYRGQGLGQKLLQHCLEFIKANYQQAIFWCNARTAAVNLYKRQGFRQLGEQFDIPDVGPHYRMIKHD